MTNKLLLLRIYDHDRTPHKKCKNS